MRHRTLPRSGLVFLLLGVLAATGLERAHASDEAVLLLHCGQLLDRPDRQPRARVTLVIEGGEVKEVREGFVEPSAGEEAEVIDLRDRFVLPGLIDCHTHITGEYTHDARLRRVTDTDADATIDGVVYAERTLRAGFTTIRNLGSSGDAAFALRDAIAQGKVPGPRILVAGQSISPTGGHSDDTLGYRDDLFAQPTPLEGIADGAAASRRAVRAQVKRGADVIKLTATGGVLSNTKAGVEQQFFADELEAIVATGHQLGRKVAAHAHGATGIKAALRAGVDSIEHGTYLDDECIELFRETGAFLVPTLLAGAWVADKSELDDFFPPPVRVKAAAVGPQIQRSVAKAHRAGVRIAFGTDCGVSAHGDNAQEFALMVEAGLTPREALVAATLSAAELCDLSDEIGSLEPGKRADVIAVEGSPLDDVRVLERVGFVMRDGRVFVR